jgi:acetate kinase
MNGAILTLNGGSSSLKFAHVVSATPAMALLQGDARVMATDKEPIIARHVRDSLSSLKRTGQNFGTPDDRRH